MNTKTLDYYLTRDEHSSDHQKKGELKKLVELFHENTKTTSALKPIMAKSISHHLTNSSQIYLDSRNKKKYVFNSENKLPKPNTFNSSFEEIIIKRETKTKFKEEPLTLQELSDILSSLRVTRVSNLRENAILNRRTYASAGALFPIEIYGFQPNKDYTKWDCFNYNPINHSNTVVSKDISLKELSHALQIETHKMKCGAIFILTGVFDRSVSKYGALGYRFALIEAGGIIQQLGLAGASMNLKTLTWGGALDNSINDLLKIDGIDENYLISFFVGH